MQTATRKNAITHQLKNRDFLTLADYTKEELAYLLRLSAEMKGGYLSETQPLKGKTLGMLFEKSSTRTRVSFEAGIAQLGGTGIFLEADHLQLGRGETIGDTAKVMSAYVDGILIRTYSQEMVNEFAENATVPIINGLTDMYHPCQVLADLLTIKEVKGGLKGKKLAYIGDGNNMTHSLMYGAAMTGMDISIAAPAGYQPKTTVIQNAVSIAKETGSQINVGSDPYIAAEGADSIYTDVWASMGQEEEKGDRESAFLDFQVNAELLSLAHPDAIFMHCLPAHRGEEVTADVMDSSQSVVFQQAENRLHAQKALMTALMS